MNKGELIAALAAKTEMTKTKPRIVLPALPATPAPALL